MRDRKKIGEDITDNRCPSCRRPLIKDLDRGEIICSICGFVVSDQAEDLGPEWKAIDLEDKSKRVRTGSPRTLAIHDYGLSTQIGSTMKDSYGRSVDPQMRSSFSRMNMWQKRIRTSSSEERTLSNMLSKITDLCENLKLPRNVCETAAHEYRTALKMRIAKSKSTMGIAAAIVYLACRKCGVQRMLKEVGRAAGIDAKMVAKYYRLLVRDGKDTYIPPPLVESYISKLVNLAKLDGWAERVALQLARKTGDVKILGGRSPNGLAAAYIYISSVLLGEHLPQREIAEVADVTEVTVRNRCREIIDNFVIRQHLKPAAQ